MLRIGLAKGRISDDARGLLINLGFDVCDMDQSRKLIFVNTDASIHLVMLKAADIPLFVHDGSLDLGILGKDSVLESGMDVYELYNLGFSKCRLCIAGPKERRLLKNGIRVATKYPEITKRIMKKRNIEATIIQLSGSIELAPLIELSDIIVDLVQSGQTLKENNLEIYETVLEISATVIANQASYLANKVEIARFISVCEELEVLSEAI